MTLSQNAKRFGLQSTIILLGLLACIPGVSASEDADMDATQQQVQEFSISGYSDKGRKDWDLQGKSADITPDVIMLDAIVSNLYKEKDTVTLTADKGNFDKSNSKVHLEQNVVITTASGAQMKTDSLDWDRTSQTLSTDDPVNIAKDNMVTTAVGATGMPDLNKVNLEKNVQVNITPASTMDAALNQIAITCDGPMEVDYQKNLATLLNNVKVETKDVTICSDRMEVYFLRGQGSKDVKADTLPGAATNVERIIAKGNVRIIRGENVSYSDAAIYTASDRKVTLEGKPKLVIYSKEGMSAPFGN